MAQVETHAPIQAQSNSVGRNGFRKAFKKWKDKLRDKTPPTPSPQAQTVSRATSVDPKPPSHQPSLSQLKPTTTNSSINAGHPPSQHAAQFFVPTTQTTIHSPADPRNRSKSPPTSLSLNGTTRVALSRRISAPADYFSSTHRTAGSTLNTNTTNTALTGTSSMHKRRGSRLRLSFAKRNSTTVQPTAITPCTPPSTAPTPISPTPSAPTPTGHERQNNTFQYTTAADIAARMQAVDEELGDAAEVIKRDKPKDWLDPGWREREEKEREHVLEERRKEEEERERLEKEENELIGNAVLRSPKIGKDGDGAEGVLKKWEWGK